MKLNATELRVISTIAKRRRAGVASIRERKKVDMVVELVEWSDTMACDRLGVDEEYYELLGINLPVTRIPVRPGRNITTIVEVAARNQLLKEMGYHSAIEFQDRLERRMAEIAHLHSHEIIGDNLE